MIYGLVPPGGGLVAIPPGNKDQVSGIALRAFSGMSAGARFGGASARIDP